MSGFKVAVTVKKKVSSTPIFAELPIWNKVHMSLSGNRHNLLNLQSQLNLIKQDVNADMNKKGLSLKDIDIYIEFLTE